MVFATEDFLLSEDDTVSLLVLTSIFSIEVVFEETNLWDLHEMIKEVF